MPFHEFYDTSQDSFKDMVDKYVVNISLTDEEIKHIECIPGVNNPLICGGSIDKKFYLEKANGKIQFKRSYKYFYQIQGQMFCTQLKRVDFIVYFGKNVPLYVETNV